MSFVDLQNIQTVEFGVCCGDEDDENYFLVPVDVTVQNALKEMAYSTASQINCFQTNLDLQFYEPAEKYGAIEKLRYPVHDSDSDGDITPVRLFVANNLSTAENGLNYPTEIIFYFAFFRDQEDRKLLAIRRATQFKGVLKSKGRLIHWLDNTMKVVEDDVFKLDQDFDYLVTDDEIYILRPNGFEFTAAIDERLLEKSIQNTRELQNVIPFVQFEFLTEYVSKHKRAARLVAAIRSRNDLCYITKESLRAVCDQTGIVLEEIDGKLQPMNGQEIHFLMLLDRRRYCLSLIDNSPETYEAASRRKV